MRARLKSSTIMRRAPVTLKTFLIIVGRNRAGCLRWPGRRVVLPRFPIHCGREGRGASPSSPIKLSRRAETGLWSMNTRPRIAG